jgi:hypothetical protein
MAIGLTLDRLNAKRGILHATGASKGGHQEAACMAQMDLTGSKVKETTGNHGHRRDRGLRVGLAAPEMRSCGRGDSRYGFELPARNFSSIL